MKYEVVMTRTVYYTYEVEAVDETQARVLAGIEYQDGNSGVTWAAPLRLSSLSPLDNNETIPR